jgi:hypothetical protein
MLFVQLRIAHVLLAFSVLLAPPMRAATDPEGLLKEADRLAELGNLNRARDLYAEAEALFEQGGDRAKMFHARFGRLRRDVEKGPYDSYLQLIAESLTDPVVAADPLLQIPGLSVQGLIHMISMARRRERTGQQLQSWPNESGTKNGEIVPADNSASSQELTVIMRQP